MTPVSNKDQASVLDTLVLLTEQPTAIQLMDMLMISSSAVLAHVAWQLVMECSASKRPLTSDAITTTEVETLASDHKIMVMTT
jgi:hypothetical protein